RMAAEQPAPRALLRWLATQRAESASGDEAQVRLESDRNLVQVVTIHKAKGLEYAIVFCPFAWDGFLQARREPYAIEYHDDSGNAVIDFRPGASDEKHLKKRRKEELAAERVRLIYVALTRAIHRCYLIAGCYVQYGRAGASFPRQSTRSVLNWLAAKTRLPYEQWSNADRPTIEIEQAWKQIADDGAPHILLTETPQARAIAFPAPAAEREAPRALPPPARIDPGWRIGSFTALVTGAAHEAAASDHDARTIGSLETAVPDDLPAHDILRFPRGPSAGDCLHAMFERADFSDPSTWESAIKRALALHPQRVREASGGAFALQRRMLQGLLEDVLSTPLHGGVQLARVPMERRLNELGFHLPAADLSPARLNGWLRSNGYAAPRLTFDALRGYLNGY
ncbi:MAG: 3'-5' exonuclease, partial [Terriglobales bacterium]